VAERRAAWHLRLDRLTHRWVDRYVCVSEAVARFSAQQGRLPAEKLTVIPNGVDLTQYPAQPASLTPFGIRPGRRAVVFVGRLDQQKGVRWLIESAPAWLELSPDCDLLLVGEGPEGPWLKAACQSLGIASRVHFAGWQSDVPGIVAASELLILPSAWEGMPNVVLQAMASSRPVVATDVEGVRELLGPQSDLQTVSYFDSTSLVRQVTDILFDRQRAAQLGALNRMRSEQEFSIARVVATYQELWESLLAGA
jgi:starch synthase (maltosyl-transferring)